MTQVSPLHYTFASLRQGVSTAAPSAEGAPQPDAVSLRFEAPPQGNVYTPNPTGGYVSTAAAKSTPASNAAWFNYFSSPDSAHTLTMADIVSGLKLTVDTTEVTLTTARHSTQADVLTQLATDINASVPNVSASWHSGLSRFKLEKTDGSELKIGVGTSGDSTSLNEGLLTLLQKSTAAISTSATPGTTSHNGELSFQSPWPTGSVILNGVTLGTEGTDTMQGRLDAINAATSLTGVRALGEPARLELTMAFSDTQSAETFEHTSVTINGVEFTLGTFEPGDTEADVLGSLWNQMNGALTEGNLTHLTASLVDDTLILEGTDLRHGVEVDMGSALNTTLISELGGARFAMPTLRLESQTSAPIQITSPYAATSAPQLPEAPAPAPATATERLHFAPSDLPVLYLPGGLLEGESAPGLTGQARTVAAQNETLAWSRGLIYRYDTVNRSTRLDALARPQRENTTLLDAFI